MAEPFLSEIRMMSFGFPPKGWALCDGQLLPINQNQALFSLLGTTYGGDGRVNFGLPNLDGRTPMHMGNGHTLGERGGEQGHTLSISEIPTHTHTANATSDPHTTSPENYQAVASDTLFAVVANLYTSPTNLTSLLPATLANIGGSQVHLNMQPFLTINFSIALQGIFPSQN
jgi:microcystin-dependent protein